MSFLANAIFAAIFALFSLPSIAASLEDLTAFNLIHNECKFEQDDLERCYQKQLTEGIHVDLPAMIPHLQNLCDEAGENQAQACYYAGRALAIYQNDGPVRLDGPAMQDYLAACNLGNDLGCTYAYQRITLVADTRQVIQGQIKLQESCYDGQNRACRMLGNGLSDESWQGKFNLRSMSASYNEECNTNGNIFACSILAYDQKPGFPAEEAAEIQLGYLQSSCQKGISENCIFLGDLYALGTDEIPADLDAAANAYNTACQDDDDTLMPKACALYAEAALASDNSEATINKVASALTRACVNGNARACLQFGDNIPPNLETLQQDCDASNPYACMALGMVYYDGQWVEPDTDLAFEKMQAACSLEQPTACALMAQYLLAPEAPSDGTLTLAVDFKERACLYGDAPSCKIIENIPQYFIITTN